MPGTYELQVDYGWVSGYDTKGQNAEELLDFQIEIYSHYQDSEANKILHVNDRGMKILENSVRDLSVISFMDRKAGQYLAENLPIPTHPEDKGKPINIPFKIVPDNAQVLIVTKKRFTYLESIQILRKDASSVIKKLGHDDSKTSDSSQSISEVLSQGEYILQLNYKNDDERFHNSTTQELMFGISSYENIKRYKECHNMLLEKCTNSEIANVGIMLTPNNGELRIKVDPNMPMIDLKYSYFLTQGPLKLYADRVRRSVSLPALNAQIARRGNHTVTIKGPELTLDETCILATLTRSAKSYLAQAEGVSPMPGVTSGRGVQSIYINSLSKGTTNLPLPSFKDYSNETVFSSTLLLHFDNSNRFLRTASFVELDLNFDTEEDFNFKDQLYYESAKDKIISFIDVADQKPSSEINKQFEVVHTKDMKSGSYLAHFVVLNGDDIATRFDQCNVKLKSHRIQKLDENSSFYYNEFGKEDFGLAITPSVAKDKSKFYDSESDVFYVEVIYEITKPTFIELSVEFDISLQNVDLFVFQDFNDEDTLEDQELAGSTLEIPSMVDSIVSRHTSIYLSRPGKYSVFIVDKKLPLKLRQLSAFDGESPCVVLQISHSIQPFSPEKLVKSSVNFLSVWPRRLELGEPFFVNPSRNLEVDIYPNSLKISRKDPPKVRFAVIDLESNKKLYNIDPDFISVVTPTRKIQRKDGLEKFVNEIQIRCNFKAETLQNVIGAGRILTLSDPDQVSDKTFVPYYVIIDSPDTSSETLKIQPNKTTSSQQQVKDKLTLKQQRKKLGEDRLVMQKCQKTCENGD